MLKVTKNERGSLHLVATKPEIQITRSPSGWSQTVSEIGFSEWELYVTMSAGQGGKTRWAVVLVSCDMDLDEANGICAWGDEIAAIEDAILKMTENWIEPLLG